MDRVLQLKEAQDRAINVMEGIPSSGDVGVVLHVCQSLRGLMDAEVRHVALIGLGLERTLSRLFVECVSVLCQVDGCSHEEILRWLRDDIFEPRNRKYGDSFVDFGAVGVVIRLLDQARILAAIDGGLADDPDMPLAHIANYATMAMVLLK